MGSAALLAMQQALLTLQAHLAPEDVSFMTKTIEALLHGPREEYGSGENARVELEDAVDGGVVRGPERQDGETQV